MADRFPDGVLPTGAWLSAVGRSLLYNQLFCVVFCRSFFMQKASDIKVINISLSKRYLYFSFCQIA